MKNNILRGVVYACALFVVLGVVTKLIPTPFFGRMASVTILDYVFLTLTAGLFGTYLALPRNACRTAAGSGGIFGFLGFGCALCNKILLLVLGVAGVLSYVEPYRPVFGSIGVGLLGYAVYKKARR